MAPERTRPTGSTGALVVWLLVLVVTSVNGAYLTAVTMPAGQKMFDTPWLYWSIFILVVPCTLAGWFAPQAALVVPAAFALGAGLARRALAK